jgi:hypothetical protein
MGNSLSRIAALGCCICGAPAEIHHVRRYGEKRKDSKAIPLCPKHHRTGGHGVAIHEGRKTWREKYGSEEKWLAWVEAKLDSSAETEIE